MLVHAFLIKYAEIALKGKNRYRFEDALVHQMEIALSKIEGDFEVKKEQGRVYVFCPENYDYDEAVDALQHVFGIVGICPVMIYEEQGFEKLAEDVVGYMKQWHPDFNGSFKVWTRRAKKSYPISSMEVSIRSWIFLLRSVTRFTYIPRPFRAQAECPSEQTEKPCFFFPVGSTVRLPAI